MEMEITKNEISQYFSAQSKPARVRQYDEMKKKVVNQFYSTKLISSAHLKLIVVLLLTRLVTIDNIEIV